MKYFIQFKINSDNETVDNIIIESQLGTEWFQKAGFSNKFYRTAIELCVERMMKIEYELISISTTYRQDNGFPINFLNFIYNPKTKTND